MAQNLSEGNEETNEKSGVLCGAAETNCFK
jgi:hypothetical protein